MSDVTVGSSTQSSLVQSTGTVFNLRDEKDVIALLRQIHQSPLQPDDKNELRDVIFTFRSSQDAEFTQELLAKFAEYGFILSGTSRSLEVERMQSSAVVTSKPIGQFGTTRPSPLFSKVTASSVQQATVSEPVTPEPVTNEPIQAEPVVQSEEVISPVVSEVKTDVAPKPKPEPALTPEPTLTPPPPPPSTSTSTPTPIPATDPTPIAVSQIQENITNATTTSTTPQEATTSNLVADSAGALGRIKEIKKEVNLLVGNPIMLVDSHNEVGREYMNALLDAMKKNNGGTLEQVEQAMNRLEAAFSSVKHILGVTEEVAQGGQIATSVPSEEPVVVSSPPVTPEPVTPEPVAPIVSQTPVTPESVIPLVKPEPELEPVKSGFTSVYQAHTQEDITPVESTPTPVPQVEKEEVEPVVEPVPTPTPEIPTMSPEVPDIPIQESATTAPISSEQKPFVSPTGSMVSVAKEKQIQDLMTSEKQQAAQTNQQREAIKIASMDPLMTPEVTNGLQQLLSEWSLFKSSGIFGTGPSGMEHHLYKKLAILNMTAVVAGRFEGATPEIKRNITDYMNGWRYEEGILQEQGELFEHYLRRVIKHILDKRSSDLPKVKSD